MNYDDISVTQFTGSDGSDFVSCIHSYYPSHVTPLHLYMHECMVMTISIYLESLSPLEVLCIIVAYFKEATEAKPCISHSCGYPTDELNPLTERKYS